MQRLVSYAEWVDTDEFVIYQYKQEGETRASWIFSRVVHELGVSKPWLTFLHGFPTSSYDWAKIEPYLKKHFHLLYLDFLGFGASEKPKNHKYSIMEQANIVSLVWDYYGLTETAIVAHDYGASVAQELLARHDEGKEINCRLSGVFFLNAGLYPELHKPRKIQLQLARPFTGKMLSFLLTKSRVIEALSEVYAKAPSEGEMEEIWQGIKSEGGHRLAHDLLSYMAERKTHRDRWVNALEKTPVTLGFAWGMKDPIVGEEVVDTVLKARPRATVTRLENCGHYAQWEEPESVAEAIRSFFIKPEIEIQSPFSGKGVPVDHIQDDADASEDEDTED